MKVFLTVTIICLIIIVLFLGTILGVLFILKDDKDFCLDSGICTKGQVVKTKYGKIEITKENCQKYNWTWNEERKYCKLK